MDAVARLTVEEVADVEGDSRVRPEGATMCAAVLQLVRSPEATERESLRYESDRWRAMANQHPAMLWVSDTTGMCTNFNDAWLGWRGRTVDQEYGTGWLEGVHPDDADACMSTYLEHFAARTPFEMTYRLQRADGEYRPILDAAAPWLGSDGRFAGFVGSCMDITDHVATARRLAESEELYRATVEGLHEGVVVTDGSGVVLSVNPAAQRQLGVDEADLLDRPLLDLADRVPFVDSAGQAVATADRPVAVVLRTGEPVVNAVMGWALNGEVRWHLVNCRPLRRPVDSQFHDRPGAHEVFAVVTSFVDITERKQAEEDAHFRAHHDPLTGLVNRWGLRDRVRAVLERCPRTPSDVVLAYCDLDNFKQVNDSLGHAAGDALLREVAARVAACVRADDVVARVGGDELLVVLTGVRGMDGAVAAAEKIRTAVRRPLDVAGSMLTPSVSIGVSPLASLDRLDEALRQADEAMYAAKCAGRDRVVTSPPNSGPFFG